MIERKQQIVLQATTISRDYDNRKTKEIFHAVRKLSFQVYAGEVVSFVGPNGAGKTTLLRIISNYLAPTSGKISIMGIDLAQKPRLARRQLGVVFGGDRGFYTTASARDNLAFFARLLDVKESQINLKVQQALEIVHLADVADQAVGTFSKGMWQRLHIARGLVNDPKVLLLDEPTAGLDVESVQTIRRLIKHLAALGRGLILTSHAMADIEALADRIYLMGDGRIHYEGSLEGVKRFAQVGEQATLETAYLAIADQLKRGQ